MLHEYAVEPECLKDWQTFRYLIEQFGIPHGRLISQFPKKWIQRVDKACKDFTFIQKQRLVEEFKRLRRQALIRSGRNFDGEKNWKENALTQHLGKPFHAVICESKPGDQDCYLKASDITSATPLWDVDSEAPIPRTKKALGNAVKALLNMSDEIHFVDKIFDPNESRWQETLELFIHLAVDNRDTQPIFNYHFSMRDNDLKIQGQIVKFEHYCKSHLENIIPTGISLQLYRWKQKKEGDFFHARYILTEKGGARIDWGLDTGKLGETTDVSLMTDNLWKYRLNMISVESEILELVDIANVVGM